MIKLENYEVLGWEHVIRGMRNPMNSWDKSDTIYIYWRDCDEDEDIALAEVCGGYAPLIRKNDLDLMKRLVKAGSDHSKFMRMITVYVDITAPLYWWKEFDTYKIGTVANSCSTMHKIHAKQFTADDFSCEHLIEYVEKTEDGETWKYNFLHYLQTTINQLNFAREKFLKTKEKRWWWQMIQLLPSSYNQKRTVQLNYAVLRNMYHARKNHKLDEWREFCEWIESLPYSELITM